MGLKSSRLMMAGGLLGLATVVTAVVFFLSHNSHRHDGKIVSLKPPANSHPHKSSHQPDTLRPAIQPTNVALQEVLLELPMGHTIKDIDIDGSVRVDMNGNLVLDRALRRFLDFFIGLTRAPEDEPVMRKALSMAMDQNGIPEPIQAEVLGILQNYLAYREAAEALQASRDAPQYDMNAIFDELYSLRRQHMGPDVAEGFFGEEEARLGALFDRQQVMASDGLSDTERERALAAIEQNLPESTREVELQSRSIVDVRRQVRQMREGGADNQEIFTVRADRFGVEAAERLARLDEERNRWQEQLQDYRQEKARIESQSQLSDAARQESIEQLRQEYFNEQEQRRVSILDRIDASGDEL